MDLLNLNDKQYCYIDHTSVHVLGSKGANTILKGCDENINIGIKKIVNTRTTSENLISGSLDSGELDLDSCRAMKYTSAVSISKSILSVLQYNEYT